MTFESLLSPASDVVKQLGSTAPLQDYKKRIDSAYGLVDDSDEIFARFLNTHQDKGEKASDYLQRLQTILSTIVRCKAVLYKSPLTVIISAWVPESFPSTYPTAWV